jgi:hypothetical protein
VARAAAISRVAARRARYNPRVPLPWSARFAPAAVLFLLWTARAPAAPSAWRDVPGGRIAPLHVPPGAPGFTLLQPAETGLAWTNRLPVDRYAARQNLMNGTGLAFADVDGDGLTDVFFASRTPPSALFRNLGGWRFTNITAQAGVACAELMAGGAVFADVNGDGRPDLFVTSFLGPDALFLNLGGGRFTNVTERAGLASRGGATSAALADLDGDGDLDLYVCHFGIEAILRDGATISTRTVQGRPVVTGRFAQRLKIADGRMVELGEPDALHLNDGAGRFTPAPWPEHFHDEAGNPLPAAPPDFGLAVQLRDVNGDGAPDIYVCNDFQTPDRLWLNDGTGRFRAAPAGTVRLESYASMGVDFADLDRDGHLDFITVEMLSRDPARHLRQASPMHFPPRPAGTGATFEAMPRNVLQHARGDGTYAEIAWFAGVAASDWSWTPVFLDVDLDGFEDLLVSNGHLHDVNDLDVNAAQPRTERLAPQQARELLVRYPRLEPPNAAWRNRGDLTFTDAAAAWRFDSTAITHGLALADLDGDGDLDLVGSVHDGPPLVYRNDAGAPRLLVRLKGRPPNTAGVGARIFVHGGPGGMQQQEILAGGRYLSADAPERMFAAGAATNRLTVEVRWRGGRVSTLRDVPANSLVEVEEAAALPAAAPAPPAPAAPWFTGDAGFPTNVLHAEAALDEFARQPLLPRRFVRAGPALLAFDADGDGGEELVFGGGPGQRVELLKPVADGAWSRTSLPAEGALPDAVTGLAGVTERDGRRWLLAAVSRVGRGTNGPAVLAWMRAGGAWQAAPPLPFPAEASPGTLAAGDADGDGVAELFIGERLVPGRYPEPADGVLYRRQGDGWAVDAARSAALRGLGLVTAAAWADVTGDGRPELLAACEWGPVRVFDFSAGTPRELTAGLGLAEVTGLWRSLAAADLDGDGRVDFVAGNEGRNTARQRAPDGPWRLWHADFDGDGLVSVIEAHAGAGGRWWPVRGRSLLERELAWLPALFPTHTAFAAAGLPALLGEHAAATPHVEARTLATMVFWNDGARFTPQPLPAPAQWTPVSAVVAADFHGDGDADLFLAQNDFAVRDDEDRQAAGLGLVLENQGGRHFRALPAAAAGVRLPEEQRAAVRLREASGRGRLVIGVASGPARAWVEAAAGTR